MPTTSRASLWARNGREFPQPARVNERCQGSSADPPPTELSIAIENNDGVDLRPSAHAPLQHEILVPRADADGEVGRVHGQVHFFLRDAQALRCVAL
eukprot:8833806-Pyramimonas_sp.AAC.1